MRRSSFFAFLISFAAFVPATAQDRATPASPNDSLFKRARRLVAEGNGIAGRAMVDTILHRYAEGTPDFGDALYWRGALAETAADAERDYRRVIVEYPLSAYVDDALLAIAELEQARGDRAAALAHLQRFVREHPVASSARGVAAFAAARLAFEQRDNHTACGLITDARTSTPASNVELRNQIDYYGSRCATEAATTVASASAAKDTAPPVPVTTPAPVPTAPASAPARTKTTTAPPKPAPAKAEMPPAARTAPPKAEQPLVSKPTAAPDTATAPAHVAPRGIYTIQVAAYNTAKDAEALVKKLAARDVKARVSGTSKPFRVRLDFYATRQEAAAEVAALKTRGIIGFVTTEEPGAGKP